MYVCGEELTFGGGGGGGSTGGNFSRGGRVSKFLAGEGNPPPSSPVGKTL